MSRYVLLAALFAAFPGIAAPMAGGERLILPSKVMGEDRTVLVSLPDSYARSTQRYPVLYVTDGDWHFAHTRSTAAFLARNGLMPEIIVIGISNPDRTRDLYASHADFTDGDRTIRFPTSGHADLFLEFLEKELIPWVEATHRTSSLRILVGHSAGGNFALHAMRTRPALFQAVVAESPWLAWDDRRELKQLVPFLASADVRVRTLFLTSADEGRDMQGDSETVAGALRVRKDAVVRWASAVYPNETHDSSVLKGTYDALRMTFDGWGYPREAKTRLLKGTLDDVKAWYAKLGERLGVPFVPPEAVVNELGYQHLQADELGASLAAFRYNAQSYPNSPNVWDSLGDALDKIGRKDEALESYRRAVSIAEANADPNLDAYRKDAARLSGGTTPATK